MSTSRSTIRDVARAAGVSISTVSLVLNNKGHVSEATRRRVLKAARELGYVPSRAARDLSLKRTGNIGFVLRDDHFTRSEPFYTYIFLGTEFEARLHNLYVLLTTIPRDYQPRVHTPRFLRERNVDGLLVAGKVSDTFLQEVRAMKLPTVLIDYEAEGFPAVVIDNQGGARVAVEHLLQQGHRRIAFVGADLQHPSIANRLEGYRGALVRTGQTPDPALVLVDEEAEPTRATGQRLGQRLLELKTRPTAAFCANDALALGVMETLLQAGLRIPEDVALVGFDDVQGATQAPVPLTSVRVFKEQLGELAMRHLVERMTPDETRRPYARGQHIIVVPCELVVRASSAHRKAYPPA
ncbi:LacI family DNA-binding transcriptional regulator [Rhodothermus profundi]|uniref:Transcriptional regulator, LacI family n=1 Tax=Rhodothermus profundi TaxID=633813 RepID=A0A1M6XA85_9BACT|nr:LacI family DNA-binding transcriptional regulator [Rhodothermus profundi]SHL02900.1 transcriptional regulator, LacI family [Rhodothermus profundi]